MKMTYLNILKLKMIIDLAFKKRNINQVYFMNQYLFEFNSTVQVLFFKTSMMIFASFLIKKPAFIDILIQHCFL
jgi:hypothetical protein